MLFFCNDTAPTEIYPLSLHDALPIYRVAKKFPRIRFVAFSTASAAPRGGSSSVKYAPTSREARASCRAERETIDRKSTRLNSSHGYISYAGFCLNNIKCYVNQHVQCC